MNSATRSYQDPLETWSEKFSRKFKENPWVPIGCLATCGALVMSAVKLRAGKSKQMNYWLRARVGLQGVTIVALLMGSTWGREWLKEKFGKEDSIAASEPAILSKDREKKREKMEFEERLRGAQAATEQEESLGVNAGKMVVTGPTLVPNRTGEVSEVVKKSNSWRQWTKGDGSGSKEGDDSNKPR